MILRWRMVPTFARAVWHAFVFWIEGRPVLAPKTVIEFRRRQCAVCPANTNEKWPMCRACSCFLEPKRLLSSESCPDGRWARLGDAPTPLSENSALTTAPNPPRNEILRNDR